MNDEELRDLQERVALIVDMTQSQGWSLFQDAAQHTLEGRQNRVVQGRCDNWEEYKAEVAFTDGMRYVLNLPDTLQARLDQEMQLRREYEEEEAEEMEQVV